MKYIIQVQYGNPEGGRDGTRYWLAETENEMQAMIDGLTGVSYVMPTCLGPIIAPTPWEQQKIDASRKATP
jgi:hypothetical protein